MRVFFYLSALLPALALAPACGDDEGSISESAAGTTTAAGADASGSGSSASTSDTSVGSVGTSSTDTTVADTTQADAGTGTGVGTETATGTGTATATDTEASEDSTGEAADPPPPTDAASLLAWLEAGNYAGWDAEAERHPSQGPHFDGVRTFVNATLLESLQGGGDDHPVGASVVKELYGEGPEVGGWAVMVKVAPGSNVNSWYWYESFSGTTYADDTGVNGCGNCHSMGVDFIRTTLPL